MTGERQYILLADDEAAITEALSFTLERPGRTVIVCSDVNAVEIALERFPVTHLVTDVQFSGEFGFEGLHSLARVQALSPQCRIVLMTGNASPTLRSAALADGAVAVLSKPFDTADLEEALADSSASLAPAGSPYEVIRIPPLEEILDGHELQVAFQPIVRLTPAGATTFAYEALTRVSGSWLTAGPAMLFDYAQRRGQLTQLNLATVKRALEEAATLPADAALFINVDPSTFGDPQLAPLLYGAALAAGIALERIVLEVTERSGFTGAAAGPVFEELRAAGIRFAFDDHGSAYSHLAQISSIRPSFIKIGNEFGTAFEQDADKLRIVRNTIALARDFGCEPILEGIESLATERAAIEAGVGLAQGFHFSRARGASHWTGSKSAPRAA